MSHRPKFENVDRDLLQPLAGLSPHSLQVAAYLKSYEHKDRAALEALIAPEFSFTSPNHDDHIDRETYFTRCWPNSETTDHVDIERTFTDGDRVFVLYNLHTTDGDTHRNTEMVRFEGDRIREIEVFFGASPRH